MRILLFFDLPSIGYENQKNYRKFVKFLNKNGFFMIQESIYMRLLLNMNSVKLVINELEKNKPNKGLIQLLVITEAQYQRMYSLIGENKSEVLNTTDRLVIL